MNITFATHFSDGKSVKSSIYFGHDELNCGINKMDDQSCTKDNHNQSDAKKDAVKINTQLYQTMTYILTPVSSLLIAF